MPTFDLSGLTIEGTGGVASNLSPPPVVRKVKAECDGMPDGKAVTSRRMAEIIGVTHNTLRMNACDPRLARYRIRAPRALLWANAATAARFRA